MILQNNTVGNQSLKVNLPAGTPSGLYFIKVINSSKQSVYNDKLIVE
jgi:hypothetical protein